MGNSAILIDHFPLTSHMNWGPIITLRIILGQRGAVFTHKVLHSMEKSQLMFHCVALPIKEPRGFNKPCLLWFSGTSIHKNITNDASLHIWVWYQSSDNTPNASSNWTSTHRRRHTRCYTWKKITRKWKVTELKHRASYTWLKPQSVQCVKDFIHNGLAKHVIYPDKGANFDVNRKRLGLVSVIQVCHP